eukprot:11181095-Lingulodinium_polyedra.AAC.1
MAPSSTLVRQAARSTRRCSRHGHRSGRQVWGPGVRRPLQVIAQCQAREPIQGRGDPPPRSPRCLAEAPVASGC